MYVRFLNNFSLFSSNLFLNPFLVEVSIASFTFSFFLSSPYPLATLPPSVCLSLRFEPGAHSFAHSSLGQYPHHYAQHPPLCIFFICGKVLLYTVEFTL